MDRDDLGSIRFRGGGFAVGNTQNDRSSISVCMCLVMLGVIKNVEDDVPGSLHLDWTI